MDLAIIGGGPAGLSAAIRAKEAGVGDVTIFERGSALGGILNQCIHHGFGLHIFGEELTGPEYARRLIERARELGVSFSLDTMVTGLSSDRTVTAVSRRGVLREKAGAVILAMGCRERSRGAVGIPGGRCVGIYTAGAAQAFVNLKGYMPGNRFVILGSGDIGLIMARRVTQEGGRVAGVYEIMNYSGGLKRNISQCLHDYDIPLYLSHTVTRISGQSRLNGVWVAGVDENKKPDNLTEKFVDCDCLLLSVGLLPENELAKQAGVLLSPVTGGAVVDNRLETNVTGIFSCGNALHVHDLADNVTEEAYEAGKNAAEFINGKLYAGKKVNVFAGRGTRYVSPSAVVLHDEKENKFNLFFRSDNVYNPAKITIKIGCQKKEIIKRIVTPGEMESVTIESDINIDEITVEITKNENLR
ncbi:MAG: NAD(P)/FAD-dependent oxidoreductase [Defluviitaleaceae bacterium]|nr:NAD(P)/FAD-dependent oxidoreductase [Defluviitaleaceae bacterium]